MALGRQAGIWLGLFLAAITGCTGQQDSTKADEIVDVIEDSEVCENLQVMKGDPNHYGPAVGFQCWSNEGLFVAFRSYEDPAGLQAALPDWLDTVGPNNEVFVGDVWLASGDSSLGIKVLQVLDLTASPSSSIQTRQMTAQESNLTSCSSLAYFVINEEFRDDPESESSNAQYFDAFPGLEDLSNGIVRAASSDVERIEVDNPLAVDAFLTNFDKEIKAYCASIQPTTR